MRLVAEQHSMRNPRAVLLLHRTESKRGPCAAWFSSGRTDIPEIHPEIPHGGVSKKVNVLFIPSSGIPRLIPSNPIAPQGQRLSPFRAVQPITLMGPVKTQCP